MASKVNVSCSRSVAGEFHVRCVLGISTSPYRECRNIASRHVIYPALLADDPNDPGSDICEFHWSICRERGIIDADGSWR
jgi:hypothetical protein